MGKILIFTFTGLGFLREDLLPGNIKILNLDLDYNKSISQIYSKLDKFNPDLVLLVNEDVNLEGLVFERIAINLRDSEETDLSGNLYRDSYIFSDGEDGYFSNLDLVGLRNSLIRAGIPSKISNGGQAYVYNNTYYALMYYIRKRRKKTKAGLFHVGNLSSQDKLRAVKLIIEKTLESL